MRIQSLAASCAASPLPGAREQSVEHYGGLQALDYLIAAIDEADRG